MRIDGRYGHNRHCGPARALRLERRTGQTVVRIANEKRPERPLKPCRRERSYLLPVAVKSRRSELRRIRSNLLVDLDGLQSGTATSTAATDPKGIDLDRTTTFRRALESHREHRRSFQQRVEIFRKEVEDFQAKRRK